MIPAGLGAGGLTGKISGVTQAARAMLGQVYLTSSCLVNSPRVLPTGSCRVTKCAVRSWPCKSSKGVTLVWKIRTSLVHRLPLSSQASGEQRKCDGPARPASEPSSSKNPMQGEPISTAAASEPVLCEGSPWLDSSHPSLIA